MRIHQPGDAVRQRLRVQKLAKPPHIVARPQEMRAQRIAGGDIFIPGLIVGMHPGDDRGLARPEAGPRRVADRLGRIGVGEADPHVGQPLDVGRMDLGRENRVRAGPVGQVIHAEDQEIIHGPDTFESSDRTGRRFCRGKAGTAETPQDGGGGVRYRREPDTLIPCPPTLPVTVMVVCASGQAGPSIGFGADLGRIWGKMHGISGPCRRRPARAGGMVTGLDAGRRTRQNNIPETGGLPEEPAFVILAEPKPAERLPSVPQPGQSPVQTIGRRVFQPGRR